MKHEYFPAAGGGHLSRGFTLIEMVITVALVGILASAALPITELTMQRTREQELRVALRQIRSAIDAYKVAYDGGHILRQADGNGYPPSLALLADGVEDILEPKHQKMKFMRRLPRDPLNFDPSVPAADTWGKRSYVSSSDSPQEGSDVFDVYSRATGVGLNGVPYGEW